MEQVGRQQVPTEERHAGRRQDQAAPEHEGHLETEVRQQPVRGREALANAMMMSLGAFARTGDPNNAALGVQWNPWPSRLIFDADANATHIQAL